MAWVCSDGEGGGSHGAELSPWAGGVDSLGLTPLGRVDSLGLLSLWQ